MGSEVDEAFVEFKDADEDHDNLVFCAEWDLFDDDSVV